MNTMLSCFLTLRDRTDEMIKCIMRFSLLYYCVCVRSRENKVCAICLWLAHCQMGTELIVHELARTHEAWNASCAIAFFVCHVRYWITTPCARAFVCVSIPTLSLCACVPSLIQVKAQPMQRLCTHYCLEHTYFACVCLCRERSVSFEFDSSVQVLRATQVIAHINWNSNLVPLLEGLSTWNLCRFEFSVFGDFAGIGPTTSELIVPRSDQLS